MKDKITTAVLIGLLLFSNCFSPKGAYNLELTLEVSNYDVFMTLSENSRDRVFLDAMHLARDRQQDSDKDFVTLFGESIENIDPNVRLSAIFLWGMRDKDITALSTNEEVLAQIRNEVKIATDKTFELLKKRTENFGRYIEKLEVVDGKLHLVFAGIEDPDRVTKMFTTTAKLEFWETYNFSEVYQYFDEANELLSQEQASLEEKEESANEKDEATVDKGVSSLIDHIEESDADLSFEDYAKKYPLYAYLMPSYVQQSGQMYPASSARVGVAAIKDTARVNSLLKQTADVFPRDMKFAWTVKPHPSTPDVLDLVALKSSIRNWGPAMGGETISDARQEYDQNGSVTVDLQMNRQGANIWKRFTGDNIGRSIAIMIDDYVFSYPNVNDEIPNGRSTISGGDMTVEEAQDLANVLKAGRFPYELVILEKKVIKREK